MYIYDVDVLKMLLFGLVGSIICAVVSSVLASLASVTIFNQMAGPVANSLAYVFSDKATPYVTAEVEELHPERDKLQEQLEQEQGKLADLKTKLEQGQNDAQKTQAEVESRRQSPPLVYTSIGQIVDTGELDKAIVAYAEFAAKFNGHPLAEKAQEQIKALEQEKAQSAAEREAARQARIAAEKARIAAFKKRLAANQATLSEIRLALLGKSREEVLELLGPADATTANTLSYLNIKVYDPVRDRDRKFLVNFIEGRVQGVNYYRESRR